MDCLQIYFVLFVEHFHLVYFKVYSLSAKKIEAYNVV